MATGADRVEEREREEPVRILGESDCAWCDVCGTVARRVLLSCEMFGDLKAENLEAMACSCFLVDLVALSFDMLGEEEEELLVDPERILAAGVSMLMFFGLS